MQPMSTDQLLTPAEVAAILFVDPKTVTRWARAGKLDAIRTPGGHRRYLKSDVLAIMTGEHSSQKPDRPRGGAAVVEIATQRAATGTPDETLDQVSEATALALEAEAEQAAEEVLVTAAALSAAAERATVAAARARDARAATIARVPAQRTS